MALLFCDSGVMEVWPDGWLACIEGWGEVFWSLSKKNVFKKLNQVLIWLVCCSETEKQSFFHLHHWCISSLSPSHVLSTLSILHPLTTHSSAETPNISLLDIYISLLTTSLFSHTKPPTHDPSQNPKQLILFNYTTRESTINRPNLQNNFNHLESFTFGDREGMHHQAFIN